MSCPVCGGRCEIEWLGKPGKQQRLVWCDHCGGVVDGLVDCRRPVVNGFAPPAEGGGVSESGRAAIEAARANLNRQAS